MEPTDTVASGDVAVSISLMSIAAEQGSMTVSVTVAADAPRWRSGGIVNPIGLTLDPVLESGFRHLDTGTFQEPSSVRSVFRATLGTIPSTITGRSSRSRSRSLPLRLRTAPGSS